MEKILLKKIANCIFLFVVLTTAGYSQNVGINNTGATPNASALLDVNAAPTNDKGILIPRISLTQTSSNAPVGGGVATSLMVYNTATVNDVTPGYYYWDGTKWVRLLGSNNAWLLLGNAGTTAGTNFLGTTDPQDLVFKTSNTEWMRLLTTGSLGIGTATPAALLEVAETSVASTRGIVSTQYVAGTVGARLILRKARGTLGTPSPVLNGDNTGLVVFGGHDGTSWIDGGTVEMKASENWGAGANGTYLMFTTTKTGTTGRQARMYITDAGDVGINVSNPQSKLQINADVNIGREWGDVLAMTQVAMDKGEVFDVADGGAGVISMTNGYLTTNFQCGGHRFLVGYVNLPAGKYQISVQTRSNDVITNCNGGGNGPNSMQVGVWLVNGGTLVTDPTVCFVDAPAQLNTSKVTYTTNGPIATVAAGTYGVWIVPNQFTGDYQNFLISAHIWRLE